MNTTMPELEKMARPQPTGIGDVHSSEKGSGARYNSGKPDLSLIPLDLIGRSHIVAAAQKPPQRRAAEALNAIGRYQRTQDEKHLYEALRVLGLDGWVDCARVFEYGKAKYAAWNWAKGMSWSVPVACAARHLMAMIDGEEIDPESQLPHRGHVFCNVVMLLTYRVNYPDGNDLPPSGLLTEVSK